jgi:hypothetical protein
MLWANDVAYISFLNMLYSAEAHNNPVMLVAAEQLLHFRR